jgi:hypothetical protein
MKRPYPLKISAPLDPEFQPAILFNRNYVAAARKTGQAVVAASLPVIKQVAA